MTMYISSIPTRRNATSGSSFPWKLNTVLQFDKPKGTEMRNADRTHPRSKVKTLLVFSSLEDFVTEQTSSLLEILFVVYSSFLYKQNMPTKELLGAV